MWRRGSGSIEGDHVRVVTTEPVLAAQQITTWAVDHRIEIGHFSVTQPTLEDVYLELTSSTNHNSLEREAVR
jgi:hypothetical protein